MLEGNTVTGTCGSLQPVTWTYTSDFNQEFDYNFEIVDPFMFIWEIMIHFTLGHIQHIMG